VKNNIVLLLGIFSRQMITGFCWPQTILTGV